MSEVSAVTQKIVVQTKNCVPDEQIIEQVKANQARGLPWMEQCKAHDRKAVMVCGGPSWVGFEDEIHEKWEAGETVFCVKSSHDRLIEKGTIPFACILLDPRDHVKDFVSNPHPDVRYLVASMVHPSTLDGLVGACRKWPRQRDAKGHFMKKRERIFLYHALVGAGEAKAIKGGLAVVGGSTSATRGLPLLKGLGFRKFDLYGFDSCYGEEVNGYQSAHKDGKHIEVTIEGRKFITDTELLAQSQDFEKIVKGLPECEFELFGDGMIPHVWDLMEAKKGKFADFERAYA